MPQIVIAVAVPLGQLSFREKGPQTSVIDRFCARADLRRPPRTDLVLSFLVAAQILDGVSGAIITMLTV